jgi:hypothetical protein
MTMRLTLPWPASTTAGFLALCLPACSVTAPAGAVPIAAVSPMRPAEVQIVDRSTGELLPIHGHGGERWVAGAPGHRYAIRVQNRTDVRLLAVTSVDGLNVVTGQTAGWDQSGYVFAPGERDDIAGWRKSQERIAAFEFAALPDSYAARTGRPDNVGVIGVALFREASHPVTHLLRPRSEAQAPTSPAPARRDGPEARDSEIEPSSAARNEQNVAEPAQDRSRLGTAHGRSENDRVGFTEFERAQSTPDEIITIRYDRRENLIAMGVLAPSPGAPIPFPSSIAGFVPDPPAR